MFGVGSTGCAGSVGQPMSRKQSCWNILKMYFHALLLVVNLEREGTVEKVSSKTTWYCSVILPVVTLRTNSTSKECCWEKPRNIPKRARGDHFEFPTWRTGSRTYTGHPKTWGRSSLFVGEWTWDQSLSGVTPCCRDGMRLKTQTA